MMVVKQKVSKKKTPPISEDRVTKEAWLLCDINSTVRSKKYAADTVNTRIEKRIESASERSGKEKQENGHETTKAKELQEKVDFLTELYDFVQMQVNAFISINNSFNDKKKHLRTSLENKLKAPPLVKFMEKAFPWLFAGGVGAGIGLTIWSVVTSWLESKFPSAYPGIVKDITNFVGLIFVGVAGYLLNRIPAWNQSRLEKKYDRKIRTINEEEGEIRTRITDLVQVEYRRLAEKYVYDVPDSNEQDKKNAIKIIEEVKNNYGFTLPYPPFDGVV